MMMKHKNGSGGDSIEKRVSGTWILLLCIFCFALGMLLASSRIIPTRWQDQELQVILEDCTTKRKNVQDSDVMGEVSKTHEAIQALDKKISMLEFFRWSWLLSGAFKSWARIALLWTQRQLKKGRRLLS